MSHPNILIVMTDGLRRDAIGFMNRDPVFTPHLDAFSREACHCSQAVTNSPLCTPARACFLTGKHAGSLTGTPPKVNMLYNWQRLPVEEETFAKSAAQQGYDTALIGKWHLDEFEESDGVGNLYNSYTPPGPRRMGFRYWYSHGCNHNHFTLKYMDTEGNYHDLGEGWQVDHETDKAIQYMENRHGERPADKPFLLWMNWGPPHNIGGSCHRYEKDGPRCQYAAPEEDEALYRRDPLLPKPHPDVTDEDYSKAAPGYFGTVTNLDRAFGRLTQSLEELGIADNTIVVFTSDHGEMLGIHGRWMKDVWYEESIGVPLLIRYPGVLPAGTRSDAPLGLIDVFPTIFHLADLQIPSGRHGIDRSDQLKETIPPDPRDSQLLAFNTGAPPKELTRYEFPDESGRYWRGIRTSEYTYVILDQRETNYRWFFDATQLRDAFPPGTRRVAYDLRNDPHQMHPILEGAGRDDLLDHLHTQLVEHLDRIGDRFIEDYWAA